MDKAAISLVIPVFNAERYIAATIESVLAQTVPADEIIAVIDGASDGTPAILAGYGDRLTLIAQANRGVCAALNRGVEASKYPFLCFLDHDDLWVPDKLKKQMEWLTRHPETEAVFGYARQFISEELDEKNRNRLLCPPEPQPGIAKTTMLIRRAAFERVGAFDETLRCGDFVDWFARARDVGLRTHVLTDVVTLRRLHTDNMGLVHYRQQQLEYITLLKRTLDRRRARAPDPLEKV
jgi:glycosyltransferase involved in cell wall biosynthesis